MQYILNSMKSNNEKINTLFFYWLVISFLMVCSIIIVGGLTRLTNSGLSITEWELFSGVLPPFSNTTWNNYFNLYKEIPQYKLLNSNMTLDEFKIIFYWEYAHRFIARLLGLFFILPCIYFYLTRKIDTSYLKICFLISVLILFQGLVGWYMVKSGLVNKVTVSHFRLSLHLTIAFIIISMIFWNILNFKKRTFKIFFKNDNKSLFFNFLVLIVFFQIIFGAFVSGLDAGQIYQTWPLMNQAYFPDDININNVSYLLDLNNQSLIQFYHRNIAYLIVFYVLFLGIYIYIKKINYLFNHYFIVLFCIIFQIFLGIITLTSGLNIYLASSHQIGSLLLVLSVINLHYRQIN